MNNRKTTFIKSHLYFENILYCLWLQSIDDVQLMSVEYICRELMETIPIQFISGASSVARLQFYNKYVLKFYR